MSVWLDRLSAEVETRLTSLIDRPLVVGLSGGVASGKSTVARALAARLAADGLSARIVSTDGFLFSNAELTSRGLMERKGFPESYDWEALAMLLGAVSAGSAELIAPTYSHETYDVGPPEAFARPRVLILEGLIALDARVTPLDLGVYLDADEDDLIAWYIERFMALGRWAAARLADRLAAAGSPEALALDVWTRINSPNLHDHILPGRDRADIVLRKARDHSVRLARPA